jgi:hypothetical protein
MTRTKTRLTVSKNRWRLLPLFTAGVSALSVAGCQGEPPRSTGEQVEAVSRAVLNGWAARDFPSNGPPTIALYHGTAPRPCSASMITWNGWVLTGAHCVVVNPQDHRNSPLLPVSSLKAARPGAMSPGLEAPADAVGAQFVAKEGTFDIALVFFPGLGSSEHTSWNRRSTTLYVGAPSELSGKAFDIWGYGRSVFGGPTDVEDGTSGAGTLRWGKVIFNRYANPFTTNNLIHVALREGAIQETWRGDSGGPTLLRNIVRWEGTIGKHVSANTQVSVHEWSAQNDSSGTGEAGDVTVRDALPWINAMLGYHFFIKRHELWDSNNGYITVQNNSAANGTLVSQSPHTDAPAQRWQYHTSTGELRNTLGNCLAVQNGSAAVGTPVWTWQCDGSASQRWTFHPNNQIRNANGLCLAPAAPGLDTGLAMATCWDGAADQRWVFSANP